MRAPNADGLVKVSGVVNAHARAFVQNDRTSDIVGQRTGASGRYVVELEAEVGDVLLVWQTIDTTESQVREVTVPDTDQLDANGSVPGAAGGSGE